MSQDIVIKAKDIPEMEAQRKLDVPQTSWTMEITKMLATLALNLIVIIVLVIGAMTTGAELSTRFMSLLEIVIGAIFGVTATQITKG